MTAEGERKVRFQPVPAFLCEQAVDDLCQAYQRAMDEGWHENENSYLPFVRYMLGVLVKAYDEFESRVEHLAYRKLSKSERVREIISRHLGKITKREIMELAPDISETTIEMALAALLAEGVIEKVGKARATGYVMKDTKV